MSGEQKKGSFDGESITDHSRAKGHAHAFHAHETHNHETTDAVSQIRKKHKQTLRGLGNNSIGAALIIALAEAGELQKQVEVADMQFNHIEVELGPIPALRLQYKNDYAIKHYIHQE